MEPLGYRETSKMAQKSGKDLKRKESVCSEIGEDGFFDIGDSMAAEEYGDLLSSEVEIDADEVKVDVKVEDMLGDLSWYFEDNSAKKDSKGKKGNESSSRKSSKGSKSNSSSSSKGEQEEDKDSSGE